MFYWILKPFIFVFFRVFYKYDYKGRENIPNDRPVVFAPNHVNAFIDPIALGLLSNRKIRFFARGDVFKSAFSKWILDILSISPMYRLQEGYAEIKKNDKTFEECRNRLANNEAILLFPEAICVQERRLRPLKKGLARIVFQTEETMDFKKDVLIIPVGLNYTAAYKFRSKLFIDIGKPISVKEYETRYKNDKVRTINDFTRAFEKEMAAHMVILHNKENDQLLLHLEEVYLHQWLKTKGLDDKNLQHSYEGSKELAGMINYLDESHPDLILKLRSSAAAYINKIRGNGLRDHLLRPENISKASAATFFMEYFLVMICMPIYALGLMQHYPPYYFAKKFSKKKIRNIEFFASVYANLAMVFWIIYAIFQIIILALIFRSKLLLLLYTLLLPVTGAFTLWFYPVKEKIFGRWRLLRMVRKNRSLAESIIKERYEIVSLIEKAKQNYIDYLRS